MTVRHTAGQFQLSASGAATQFGVSGGYGVWISRPGYLPRQHVVAMGSINERIKMMPQVVISGRVTDEDGFPAQNANVQALRRLWVNGRQELSGGGGTSTDD
jgi:hypothetical protein